LTVIEFTLQELVVKYCSRERGRDCSRRSRESVLGAGEQQSKGLAAA
jgi:hypothetical protein